ncbi:MAG: 2-oxoacid:acceptor oxidoreductase family protein [Nanoarchaeota archaeon]
MRFNIIIGGKAGQGPNIVTEVVSQGLVSAGYHAFYAREYESLIRGGHNYNTLTFSLIATRSNQSKIDILVCLDDNTEKVHKENLKKNAIVLKYKEPKENMHYAGALYKILGLDFRILENQLRKLKNLDENLREARKGFNDETRSLGIEKPQNSNTGFKLINGNHGISEGAIKSGLQYYYSYPMTPATPVMMMLGDMMMEKDAKHKVIELESEIAVVIATLGSSLMGARAMCGTSGGGFDLMTEGLSMAGQAEIPIVIYLSSRPGPSTGLATYSSQGDLDLALYSGHGEFNRVVIAPGDALESAELTNQGFYFSQKFRTPVILLGDKNLAESKSVVETEPKIIEIINSITSMEKFNSYEHNEAGIAIEDAETTAKNFDRRAKIGKEIAREAQKFEMYKIHGNKNSKNLIIGWGSTKGAILDAMHDGNIDAKFLQILYLEPFPEKILDELKKANKILIVENNATSQLSKLIATKTGFIIEDKNKILRYDGRAFFSDELAEEIKRRMR